MDKLRMVLGDELFNQVVEKIAGNEEIKLVNVADGNYIEKSKHDEEINKIKYDFALEAALKKSGVRSTKALKALIDETALTFDEEGLHGVDEQIEALKIEHNYRVGSPLPGGLSHGGSIEVTGVEKSFLEKNPHISRWFN